MVPRPWCAEPRTGTKNRHQGPGPGTRDSGRTKDRGPGTDYGPGTKNGPRPKAQGQRTDLSAQLHVDREAPVGLTARAALWLTAWTERWVPDAFIFALLATFIVVAAAVFATPSTLPQGGDAWGNGFWDLIPFTLQMSLVIISGHVLATSPAMRRVIHMIASWPKE